MFSMRFSQWGVRFWNIAGAVSIRVKVLGIVIGVVLLLAFFVMVQTRLILYRQLSAEIRAQGVDLGQSLAPTVTSYLQDEAERKNLAPLLRDVQHHYSDPRHNTLVEYILVVDAADQVIAHTYPDTLPDWVTPSYQALTDPRIQEDHTPAGNLIHVIMPVPEEAATLHIALSEQRIRKAANAVTLQIFYVTVIMLIVGMSAAIFLTWILTRPILTLVEATRAVAAGDYARQVPRWAADEIGELSMAFNQMTAALARADKERRERDHLREQYISGVISAQEEERKRIARELHDSTSQALSSLLIGLRHMQEIGEVQEIQARADDLRKVVSQTLDEVHLLAHQLRPSVLDDVGLIAAIERMIQDYRQRYQLNIDLIARNITRLPAPLETSIYRIVQEGLTNMARHAQATDASILIENRGASIRMIVEDNGKGFDPAQVKETSLGLQGIQERARLFGGHVTIESTPGTGTSLFVELPHQGDQHHDLSHSTGR